MNIDFSNAPGFSTYVLLLIFSGVVMVGLSAVAGTSRGLRALNGLFGLGFLGYGFYLAFVFNGGSYLVFFKAFILPAVMLFKTLKGWAASRNAPVAGPSPSADPVAAQD